MKHITTYKTWTRVHESEEERDQEMEDVETLFDLRTSAYGKTPSSSPMFKFDGLMSVDEMLARFIYQLALDTQVVARNILASKWR